MFVLHNNHVASFKQIEGPINISESRLRILLSIKDVPKDLKTIAKEMGTTEQNAYYHLKSLIDAGLVSVIHGDRKRYVLSADAFGYLLRKGKPYRGKATPGMIENFFYPLAEDGQLKAYIVVGAPDPHGVFMQRARDGHYVGVLGLFLGQFFELKGFPVMIDTDIRAEQLIGENLILVGGPAANMVSWDILGERTLFFDVENPWMLRGRRNLYGEDSVGVIAKFRNPYGKNTWTLLIAGVRAVGTKAAIMALSTHWEELLGQYRKGKEFYWIVQGFDRDADGHIDSVEVKEYGEIRE